jgi:hypothetical protein
MMNSFFKYAGNIAGAAVIVVLATGFSGHSMTIHSGMSHGSAAHFTPRPFCNPVHSVFTPHIITPHMPATRIDNDDQRRGNFGPQGHNMNMTSMGGTNNRNFGPGSGNWHVFIPSPNGMGQNGQMNGNHRPQNSQEFFEDRDRNDRMIQNGNGNGFLLAAMGPNMQTVRPASLQQTVATFNGQSGGVVGGPYITNPGGQVYIGATSHPFQN